MLKKNNFLNTNDIAILTTIKEKTFIKENLFIKSLINAFKNKNISLSSIVIDSNNLTNLKINLTLFYKTKFLNFIRKIKFNNKKKLKFFNFFNSIILKQLNILKINNVIINLTVLNIYFNRIKSKKIYKKYKKYIKFLYMRRQNLFYDLIKATCLMIDNKISIKIFLSLLIKTFYVLPKGKHSKFLFFLKDFFKFLIKNKNTKILGLKLIINGKIKGKMKASRSIIIAGKVPIQSIASNTNFTKAHAYTRYGVFGFKLWISFKE